MQQALSDWNLIRGEMINIEESWNLGASTWEKLVQQRVLI
jgi:hypothetical protein